MRALNDFKTTFKGMVRKMNGNADHTLVYCRSFPSGYEHVPKLELYVAQINSI